jgi:putative ABC transport system ATP-binding protein
MIHLSNICVTYPSTKVPAVTEFNMSVVRGERVALTGSSGSGKTSVLAVIGTLLRPSGGRYMFEQQDVAALSDNALDQFRSTKIGFIFQQHALLPHLCVLDNVLLPVEHDQALLPTYRAAAMELLARLGIDSLAARLPRQLSGGQSQRAAIARALLRNPELVLADEPTSALDDASTKSVVDALVSTCVGQRTLIIATHDSRVSSICERHVQIAG